MSSLDGSFGEVDDREGESVGEEVLLSATVFETSLVNANTGVVTILSTTTKWCNDGISILNAIISINIYAYTVPTYAQCKIFPSDT